MNYQLDDFGKIFVFFFTVVFVLASVGLVFRMINPSREDLSASLVGASSLDRNSLPNRDWQVVDPEVIASSAISVETDLSSQDKVLFNKEESKKLPIASITKLMTALVALEHYSLTDMVKISNRAVLQEGDNGVLKLGDSVSVRDLLFIMLIESSNHAAFALSEATKEDFISLMNQKAKEVGLNDTYFKDSTGLNSGNYSTARDLVKLTEYLLKNYPIITEISRTKEMDLQRLDGSYYGKLVNTNQLLGEIPEIVAGKTGFTTAAKGCLLLVLKNIQNNSYQIYVVLGAEDRFLEIKKIIDWVNLAYKW